MLTQCPISTRAQLQPTTIHHSGTFGAIQDLWGPIRPVLLEQKQSVRWVKEIRSMKWRYLMHMLRQGFQPFQAMRYISNNNATSGFLLMLATLPIKTHMPHIHGHVRIQVWYLNITDYTEWLSECVMSIPKSSNEYSLISVSNELWVSAHEWVAVILASRPTGIVRKDQVLVWIISYGASSILWGQS